MSWSEIVRTVRRGCGGKQECLSQLFGVSQATISRWESGRQIPGPSFREALLKLYRVHFDAGQAPSIPAGGSPVMAFHLDRNLRHLYADPGVERISSHPARDLLGHTPWETWLSPEARDLFETAGRAVLRTGQPGEVEYIGTLYIYHINLRLEPASNHLLGEVQLLKRRRGADSIGRELFHCGSVGMGKADSRRIFEANEAFLRMTGYTFEDLANGGIDWAAMTPREYAEMDRRALDEVRRCGKFRPYEKEYRRKDGTRVAVLMAGAAVNQEPLIMVFSVIDLSASWASFRIPSVRLVSILAAVLPALA